MRTTPRVAAARPSPAGGAGRRVALALVAVAIVGAVAAGDATAQPATPAAGPAVTVAPSAGGPPVAIVWRTGRTIRGSAIDGSGARRLAVLRTSSPAAATPSPDGRRIALVADDRLFTLELDGSGVLRDRGRVTIGWTLRWSPDGSRIAVVDPDGLAVCGATDAAPAGCARWAEDVSEENGGTWSPDGTRVAVVRDDLAIATYDGATTRVVERHPVARGRVDRRGRALAPDRVDFPSAPVWTRAGLTWSTFELLLEDGELAGIGRTRIRRQEGAAVRTLAVVPPRGRAFTPFAVGGELPDGTVIGVRERFTAQSPTAWVYDLRRLHPGGSIGGTPVSAGPFEPGMGNASMQVAGTMADGRVALIARGSEARPARLYLADPARGLGRRVALGDEVAVATALPGNPADG